MNKRMSQAALLALAFIVSIPLGLAAQDEGYYPYSFARLTYVSGSVYVQRTADLGYEKGELNLALVQGDKIGTESGQAEIHFGRRNYLRLGDNTKVEFAILPKEGEDRIKLFLTEGQAYVRVSQLALEKGVEVHTPDASFYVLEEGLYRFDVRLDRETQAVAREGSLEAAAEDGSRLVRSGETVTAADGRLMSDPESDYARGDAFDDWNGGRDSQLSARSERQYLPSDMGDYEEELDENGRWVYEQPYGNVWVPNASYYDDWRPYSYGRWMWYPVIGWTWIASESWGWPVYHYGRWNWRFGLGWYWIPRSHWGPAWVHWWNDGNYIGWCPLTWYNRPGYLFNDRFYDRWNDRYFSAHNRAMTVIRRDHLQSPDIGRHRIGAADLDRIGRVELRAQQPGIRPAVDNARPQAVAARRALEDRSGARGRIRNVAPSNNLASPRQGGLNSGLRSRERAASSAGSRAAIARPAARGADGGGRAIRSYPSQSPASGRDRSGAAANRRATIASPSRGAGAGSGDGTVRTSRSQDRPTARESGGPATRRGEAVKAPSTTTTREGSAVKSGRTSESKPGRSQSRTYSSSSSVNRPSSRLSAPSASVRSGARSETRSSSGRTPSYTQPRGTSVSPGPSRSSGSSARTLASPRSARPSSGSTYRAPRSSSSSSGRSLTTPRSGSSSSGRSYSAPRSSGSSGRSYSAPRSGGSSSGRSSGSVRSGGSSSGRSGSSGRSSSGSSRSSGSSSRSSSSAKRKG